MAEIDDIFDVIVKHLDCASNSELAEVYDLVIGCGDCPYWHDCRNEHECYEFILDKLEG